MKRAYSKPSVYVEPIKLDTPIANTCMADRADMEALMMFQYFDNEHKCIIKLDEINEVKWGENTICYHSNVLTAFLS